MHDTFKDVREEMEEIGIVYRDIRNKYGDETEIIYLDPRNTFSILVYFLRHWKAGSISFSELCKAICFGIRRSSFFYNGRWLNPDKTWKRDELLHKLEEIRQ
ncbi:hypothetical protein [Alteribacillus sp. YIM 98480]|uniref:hypothetical protein n=1 Tax=Alteribacillus sp. YIM 98480 TaxID=2606599 RepID=UPI00131CC08A|nr:hypothetical protein [Alteribacillus sp. YIM 98480]